MPMNKIKANIAPVILYLQFIPNPELAHKYPMFSNLNLAAFK